jgi:8-oxo-dGTP diphosphatase
VTREVTEEYSTGPLHIEMIGVRNVLRTDPPSHWVAVVFAVRVDPAAVAIGEPHKFDRLGWFEPEALPAPLHSQLGESLALFETWRGISFDAGKAGASGRGPGRPRVSS